MCVINYGHQNLASLLVLIVTEVSFALNYRGILSLNDLGIHLHEFILRSCELAHKLLLSGLRLSAIQGCCGVSTLIYLRSLRLLWKSTHFLSNIYLNLKFQRLGSLILRHKCHRLNVLRKLNLVIWQWVVISWCQRHGHSNWLHILQTLGIINPILPNLLVLHIVNLIHSIVLCIQLLLRIILHLSLLIWCSNIGRINWRSEWMWAKMTM